MRSRTRSLPDADVVLRDATDFIGASRLSRVALRDPCPRSLPNFLRDLLEQIFRLQQSCHLPEFTDHGLSHLCSLVDRLSEWTLAKASGTDDVMVDLLSPTEAAILLLATLVHDIGMLSQIPDDLRDDERLAGIPRVEDMATWVRHTHVGRMKGLLIRWMSESPHAGLLGHDTVERALLLASMHDRWPEKWKEHNVVGRDAGLAALLAVADLLDEDSMRCDTSTLLAHRRGNALNYAHWLRHSLTVERVEVKDGIVRVRFGKLPGTNEVLVPAYAALRNHFRLAHLYADQLAQIGVTLLRCEFVPESDLPCASSSVGAEWQKIPGFSNQTALLFHLLRSFMVEALLDDHRLSKERPAELRKAGLESVDLKLLHQVAGTIEQRSEDEQVVYALMLEESPAP